MELTHIVTSLSNYNDYTALNWYICYQVCIALRLLQGGNLQCQCPTDHPRL